MNFTTAAETCLRKYATFSGRAIRSEYWYFSLFAACIYLAAAIIDLILGTSGHGLTLGFVYTLALLGLFLPSLAVAVRRLHDKNRSGWWLFLYLVPLVGLVVILAWKCQRGTTGENSFGYDPLEHEAAR